MLSSFAVTLLSSTLAAILMMTTGAHATPPAKPSAVRVLGWVSAASPVLDKWYDPTSGLYRTTGWWNSAHALEAELTTSELVGGDRGIRRAAATHARNAVGGFFNNFYDDEGWWALTWVHAYDMTGDQWYLDTAKSLFADMADSWGGSCGGGIWWSKDRGYKNAVANELFIALAAKLALRTDGRDAAGFRKWALRGWNWFADSGMINSSDLINDGLDSACRNNGDTTWTYNQGVILGALADLHRLTGREKYLTVAGRIADAALTALSGPDGVLREPCERTAVTTARSSRGSSCATSRRCTRSLRHRGTPISRCTTPHRSGVPTAAPTTSSD